MSISKDLLEILACPEDKSPVVEFKNGKNEYCLRCKKCRRIFEVIGGVPIMLPKVLK